MSFKSDVIIQQLPSCNSLTVKELRIDSGIIRTVQNYSNGFIERSIVCDNELFKNVSVMKDSLDSLIAEDLPKYILARKSVHKYDKIGSACFNNRAAIKLVELDKYFKIVEIENNDNLFYFADICSAPGGFSEYIYYKLGYQTKGFGFSIKDPAIPFRIKDFNLKTSPDNFTITYGKDGTGDIYSQENIKFLTSLIRKETHKGMCNLVTGDGGFSTDNDWNRQEILTKRLILCEFITALCLLTKGGHFTTKVFDTITTFTVDLYYIMSYFFKEVYICRPLQSRSMNSEKFIVCKHFIVRSNHKEIVNYLFDVNQRLEQLGFTMTKKTPSGDVYSIYDYVNKHSEFVAALEKVNNVILTKQLQSLTQMRHNFYNIDKVKREDRIGISKKVLKSFGIPFRLDSYYGSLKKMSQEQQIATLLSNVKSKSEVIVSVFGKIYCVKNNITKQITGVVIPSGTILIGKEEPNGKYKISDVCMITWIKQGFNKDRVIRFIKSYNSKIV